MKRYLVISFVVLGLFACGDKNAPNLTSTPDVGKVAVLLTPVPPFVPGNKPDTSAVKELAELVICWLASKCKGNDAV